MPKSKHRKDHKKKSASRTKKIISDQKSFQKKMNELMMKQIEEMRNNSTGETENTTTEQLQSIQSSTEVPF